MRKAIVTVLILCGSGCVARSASPAAQPFSFETPGTSIAIDAQGLMTAKYEFAACTIPSSEKQAVVVTQQTTTRKSEEISGLLSAAAAALGYVLRAFLN